MGRRRPEEDVAADFLNLDLPVEDWAKEEGIADEEIRERLRKAPTRPTPSASRRTRPRS